MASPIGSDMDDNSALILKQTGVVAVVEKHIQEAVQKQTQDQNEQMQMLQAIIANLQKDQELLQAQNAQLREHSGLVEHHSGQLQAQNELIQTEMSKLKILNDNITVQIHHSEQKNILLEKDTKAAKDAYEASEKGINALKKMIELEKFRNKTLVAQSEAKRDAEILELKQKMASVDQTKLMFEDMMARMGQMNLEANCN